MTTAGGKKYHGIEYFEPAFELAVSMGTIPGVSHAHIVGLNESVAGTFETCWSDSSVYSYLAAETVLKISSTDANDKDGESGATRIHISGLTGDCHEIDEEVIMNGQTAVNTGQKFFRIHDMHVETGAANQGIIYAGTGNLTAGTPDNKYGAIPVGYSHSLMGIFTIPVEHTGYLHHLTISSGVSKNVIARLMLRSRGGVLITEDVLNLVENDVTSIWRYHLRIPTLTDVEVQVTAAGAGGSVGCSYSILLVNE